MTDNPSLHPFASLRVTLAAALALGLAACSTPGPNHPSDEPWDPYEKRNRQVHQFNKNLDRTVIRPVSQGYSAFMPDDIESAVSRFSANLSIPQAVVNNVLQGNMKGATEDTYRFVVNTVFGLGGFFDTASELGMPKATETDFGETLHVWGVPEGAYLETPIFGPTTERDYAGRWVDLFTNPFRYIVETPEAYIAPAASVSSMLSNRGRFSDTYDSILYDSADSYAQSRSLFLQNRRFRLGEGDDDAYLDPYDDPYGALPEDPYDDPYDE